MASGTQPPLIDAGANQQSALDDSKPQPDNDQQQQQQQQQQRSKKQQQRKRGGRGATAQEEVPLTASQAEHVRVVRVEGRRADTTSDDTATVQLSKLGKAPQLQLSEDRLTATGSKGFRTVRATHGAYCGTWYCEVSVVHLGETGHVRLGWCTKKAELQAPVGFDKYGYCYRDLEGSKVNQGLRQPYGMAYGQGDVIGLLLHLPAGGRTCEVVDRAVTRYKGQIYLVDEPEPEPKLLAGSKVAFTRNGELQGVAYADIFEGTYYPAASLFTLPHQAEGARVMFNFGPHFKHAPPQLEGCGPALPVSELIAARTSAAPMGNT